MSDERIKRSIEDHYARQTKAIEFQNKASQIQSDNSVKVGDEKIQYFEKLAFGSGAIIAAVISFVGASHTVLRAPTILKWSLVLLLMTVVSAMFRNWFYPFYTIALWNRHKAQADWQVDDVEAETIADYPILIPVDETGTVIPSEKYRSDYEQRKKLRSVSLEKALRHENRLFRVVFIAETVALACVAVAMVLLVTLIWMNVGLSIPVTQTPPHAQTM